MFFLSIDGQYWIPLKPICNALNIDADRSVKNVKKDPILGPERSKQTVQVSKNGKYQGRIMTCLPEYLIYGWIFSLQSESTELTEYKRTCYKLLYNHFHGTITNRKELLMERKELDTEIFDIKQTLKDEDDKYIKLQNLQIKRKTISTQLNTIDKELIKEPKLFN